MLAKKHFFIPYYHGGIMKTVIYFHAEATVPLDRIFFRLFTIEINSAIANDRKPIGMIKMQCVTIYANIYECVSDDMKIHHDRF